LLFLRFELGQLLVQIKAVEIQIIMDPQRFAASRLIDLRLSR
jgi:hypothetical protein